MKGPFRDKREYHDKSREHQAWGMIKMDGEFSSVVQQYHTIS